VVTYVNSSSRMSGPHLDWQRDAWQVWRIALPGHSRAAGIARQSVRSVLSAWQLAHLEEAASVVVTELVANALQHDRADPPGLCVAAGDGRLRIEVYDSDPRPPQPRAPGSLDEAGRGLYLVDAIASRWGFRQSGRGKAVWAELDIAPVVRDADCEGSLTGRQERA
jgi:anti-sigma regulatory factor (Ser/Thr protein kinase)